MFHQHKETSHQIHLNFILKSQIQSVTITMSVLNLMKEMNNIKTMITQDLIITLFKKTFSPKLCWKENKDVLNFTLKPSAVSKWMKAAFFKNKIFSISDFQARIIEIFFLSFYLILFLYICFQKLLSLRI